MTTPAQPADGVEALAPAAAVAYACLRESGYHEAAANLREYLRTLAASKADSAQATPTDAARVRDAWLPIESAPQDGTLGPIGESPKTIADEMEAWSEKKMSANGSSRIDRTLVREWAKRLRGEA